MRETDTEFGQAVARDADRIVVVADAATSIYVLGAEGPELEAEVAGGHAVSLDGTRLAVGNHVSRSVYTYELTNGTWVSQGQIQGGDSFGSSVALDGTRLLVGAPLQGVGTAHVYEFNELGWVETAVLPPTGAAPGAWFGASVALDGGLALVGAPSERQPDGSTGAVYLYELGGDTWRLVGRRTATEPDRGGIFGHAVALNGGRAFVGAPLFNERNEDRGAVYVFEGTNWQLSTLLSDPGTGDSFGFSVDLDGNRAVVGAHLSTINAVTPGTAFAYAFDGQNWVQTQQLVPGGPPEGGSFGRAVAISGQSVAVGAPANDWVGPNAGTVYLFEDPFSIPQEGSPVDATDTDPLVSGLGPASPNPTWGQSRFVLSLASPERVTATVFDVQGRTIDTLVSGDLLNGPVMLTVDGSRLAPGLYLLRVVGETFTAVQPLTLLR